MTAVRIDARAKPVVGATANNAAHGAEKACGQRRVNALEELQENEANRVSLGQELVAATRPLTRSLERSYRREARV